VAGILAKGLRKAIFQFLRGLMMGILIDRRAREIFESGEKTPRSMEGEPIKRGRPQLWARMASTLSPTSGARDNHCQPAGERLAFQKDAWRNDAFSQIPLQKRRGFPKFPKM
jgi:hypothetical protein